MPIVLFNPLILLFLNNRLGIVVYSFINHSIATTLTKN